MRSAQLRSPRLEPSTTRSRGASRSAPRSPMLWPTCSRPRRAWSCAESHSGGGARTHNLSINSRALGQSSCPGSSGEILGDLALGCARGRHGRHARLDLGVAVRAEQHTLGHLYPRRRDGAGRTLHAEMEPLAVGVEMVEVQGRDTAVIAAERTTSPSLRHQDQLQLASATTDALHAAALDERFERILREPATSCVPVWIGRPQVMFPNPIRDRRFMPSKPRSDLRQRQALIEELLQGVSIHAPHCLQRLGRNA
jgi:hypothetical protein